MGIPTTLRCNSSSLSQCTHCSVLRFQPLIVPSSSLDFPRKFRRCPLQFLAVSRLVNRRKVDFICRVGEDNIEPDANDNKEKDNQEGNEDGGLTDSRPENVSQFEKEKEQVSTTEALNSLSNFLKNNQMKVSGEGGTQEKGNQEGNKSGSLTDSSLGNDSQSEKEKEQVSTTEALNSLSNFIKNNQTKVNGEGVTQDDLDKLQVSSGSPLPGVKSQQLDETIRIPKETIDILRDQVFGFDTFFVTGQEPYEGGVLFKGNLRGVASESYEKLSKRLQDRLGDQYKLFILNNPEDDKPVAVVVPKITLQPETTAVPEWFAAGSFGLVTLFTLLLRNVPELQSDLLSSFDKLELLKNGLPGALVTALILGVHELGHYFVAKDCGVKLGVPYFIPSWQIGSFGAITRIVNIVPKREDLLKIAAAGPLAGYSLGLILFFLGFILPPGDGLGIVVDGSVFHESLLVGGTAKLLLGDVLKEGQAISLNPLVLWAWAGLLVNAINSIPAGELDGGRISFAIWGRKASARFTGASIVLLGLSSLFNDVAFYWVVLIYILQRGPIAPLAEEISEPDQKNVALGVLVLLIGLLVCLPYPFPFANEALTAL